MSSHTRPLFVLRHLLFVLRHLVMFERRGEGTRWTAFIFGLGLTDSADLAAKFLGPRGKTPPVAAAVPLNFRAAI